jgi:geranylgeranyl pyrophosphate synthase
MKLHSILEPVAGGLELVRRGIHDRIEGLIARQNLPRDLVETAGASVGHLFAAEGKLLRPALVLLSARAATGDDAEQFSPALVGLAVAAELLHSASLVHDDIIDEAESRRDRESVNGRFGNTVAVLAGDILYAEFFVALSGLSGASWEHRGELFRLFADTTQRMCFGEMREHQISVRGTGERLPEYLDIVERKTAELMSVCCAGGAILCGAPTDTVRQLADFGRSFGMAFQLVDDVLDGDTRLASTSEGMERALEYAGEARGRAALFAPGVGKLALDALCAYLLDRAHAGVDRL